MDEMIQVPENLPPAVSSMEECNLVEDNHFDLLDIIPAEGEIVLARSSKRPVSLPRLYARINEDLPESYYNLPDSHHTWNSPDAYDVVRRVGRGKYSEVFEGLLMDSMDRPAGRVIIKVLKPLKKKKLKRELTCLKALASGPYIIRLLDTVKDPASRTSSLVFEYISNTELRSVFDKITPWYCRWYMFQMIVALDFAHSRGIMHRDIKPQNVIVDHDRCILRVIDWGLAEFYSPGFEYNVRVASRFYKGPELLLNVHTYDYSLDVWSLGCLFMGMLSQVEPFFQGRDLFDQMVKICDILGTREANEYLSNMGLTMDPKMAAALANCPEERPRSLSSYCTKFADEAAVDLLEQMLIMDHTKRILPRTAIFHPYFEDIRRYFSVNHYVEWRGPQALHQLYASIRKLERIGMKPEQCSSEG